MDSLTEKIHRYNGHTAYLEVRLDHLEQPAVPSLPTDLRSKLIATFRPVREGGLYGGEEPARLQLLQKAAAAGFQWVDLEHDVLEPPSFSPGTRVVRSCHDFESFPRDLPARFEQLEQSKGDAVKLAVTVARTSELTRLLRWMETLSGTAKPRVIIGMGDLGLPSRFLGAFLGNLWTYAAEEKGRTVAPGQPLLSECLDRYRLPAWQAPPAIYGVLGNPIAHSLSPALHNGLFQHYGQESVYFPFQLDDLDNWLTFTEESLLPFSGFSVTLPFKTSAGTRVGKESVNTLVRKDAGWEGLNTDYDGFLEPLRSRLDLTGATALVLGNGGVAHTVVRALQENGVTVTVAGRDAKRVSSFAKQHGCSGTLFSELPIGARLCVNTTPVGQYPDTDASPLKEDHLDFEVVYDLIYHPQRTKLLSLADRKGIQTIGGMEMFLQQAALQFKAWTGITPDSQLLEEMIAPLLDD